MQAPYGKILACIVFAYILMLLVHIGFILFCSTLGSLDTCIGGSWLHKGLLNVVRRLH